MIGQIKKSLYAILSLSVFFGTVFGLGGTQAQTVVSVTQTSYNPYGQVVCQAQRMNPSVYGALPADACALSTAGTHGSDRIIKNTYLNKRLQKIEQAVGTTDQRTYATYTYSANGQKTSETDANGNKTSMEYDGFDRLSKLVYPSKTLGAGTSNAADYEFYWL